MYLCQKKKIKKMKISKKKIFYYVYLDNNFGASPIGFYIKDGLDYLTFFRLSKKISNSYFHFFYDLNYKIAHENYISLLYTQKEIIASFSFENKKEFNKLIVFICDIIRAYKDNYKKKCLIVECEKKISLINYLADTYNSLKTCSIKQLKSDLNNRIKKIKISSEIIENKIEDIPKLMCENIRCQLKNQFYQNIVIYPDLTNTTKDYQKLMEEYQIVMNSIENLNCMGAH